MSAWHAKRTEEVLKELGTGRRSGLSEAEAGKRLGRYGRNELEHQEPDGMLRRFLAQMRDPMILVCSPPPYSPCWRAAGRTGSTR